MGLEKPCLKRKNVISSFFYGIKFFKTCLHSPRCESDRVPAGEVPNCDACARGAELSRVLRAAGRPTRGPEAQVRPHVSREVLLPQPGMEVTEIGINGVANLLFRRESAAETFL